MSKPDILRKDGVEEPTGFQNPEFQGETKIDKEFVGVGKEVPKEIRDNQTVTSDLLKLSKAVGQSVNPETAAQIGSLVQQGEVTKEEVVETIQSGEPVKNAAELLERMMNSADSGK